MNLDKAAFEKIQKTLKRSETDDSEDPEPPSVNFLQTYCNALHC